MELPDNNETSLLARTRSRSVRLISRNDHSYCEQELDMCESLTDFEQNFLLAFHDVCSEFIFNVLRRSKVSSLENALLRGIIDLNALSLYLEMSGANMIKAYSSAFPHKNGIDISRIGIHTVYDRKLKDVVCKISFFR